MQMKLVGIISVDLDTTGKLLIVLIIHSAFAKLLKKKLQ